MATTMLPFVQSQIIRYVVPIVATFGILGNTFVLIGFRNHRKNACANYMSGAVSMNMIYLSLSVPLIFYTNERGDPSLHLIGLCKSRFYFFHVWGQMSRYFIVFACIDRFALTHMNPKVRSFSRLKIVRSIMVIITIFWHLFALHIAIMTQVQNGRCGYFGVYSIINSYYVLTFNCLIPPAAMGIFGYLAYRNMKRLRTRVHASDSTNLGTMVVHRQDRNMLAMLLAEISVYIVTMSLYPVITLEVAATSSVVKDLQRIQIEGFLQFLSLFFIYFYTSAPFYIYMTVSKAFRQDFFRIIDHSWRKLSRQNKAVIRIVQSTSTT